MSLKHLNKSIYYLGTGLLALSFVMPHLLRLPAGGNLPDPGLRHGQLRHALHLR